MTPHDINDNVRALLKKMGSKETPVYIETIPEAFAQVGECFPSVIQKIELSGGSAVYGWQIWQGDFLIEAEFHAVWKSESGELFDITPKAIPSINRILFVPDSKRKYDGKQVDNVRLNITENSLVNDLIKVSEDAFALLNKGQRATLYAVSLPPIEQQKLSKLEELKNSILYMLELKGTRNTACFCSSNQKFKHCHGKY